MSPDTDAEVARVEKILREAIEEEIARGSRLTPSTWGAKVLDDRTRLLSFDSRDRCALGCLLAVTARRGRPMHYPEFGSYGSLIGELIGIPSRSAYMISRGFDSAPARHEAARRWVVDEGRSELPWWELGARLREEYVAG
jgi:hypothetical protein